MFEVEHDDGSIEFVEADSVELVAGEWHFVRTVGGGDEERWIAIPADSVAAVRTR